jgi:hypothetical protein
MHEPMSEKLGRLPSVGFWIVITLLVAVLVIFFLGSIIGLMVQPQEPQSPHLNTVLMSEFFWGVIVGLLLSVIGAYRLAVFITRQQQKAKKDLIKNFCIDTVDNIKTIVDDMVDRRQQTQVIHGDYLTLLDIPWQESKLRPGSLFLVGDPKQAIYRFRGADIEAYQHSCELIRAQDAGAILEVTANFRSQGAIIKHVNRCFEDVFARPSQPRYVPLAPTIPDYTYPVPCVTRFTIEVHTEGRIYAEMFREAEAERVAEICAGLIGNVTITRADKSQSPLQPGDIALLSPGHTDLWRYERALEKRGLAVSSQAGQTLMRRQETQDVLALLRVLADSSDMLAFGALMRGPLVGLSEQELLDITAALPLGEAGQATYFTVRTDPALVQHPLASSILQELQSLRKLAPITTPSLILATAIERLNARVIMAARHKNRNARALANLDALIERARHYGVAGLRAFVHDLQADWERKVRVPEGRIDAARRSRLGRAGSLNAALSAPYPRRDRSASRFPQLTEIPRLHLDRADVEIGMSRVRNTASSGNKGGFTLFISPRAGTARDRRRRRRSVLGSACRCEHPDQAASCCPGSSAAPSAVSEILLDSA